MEQTRENAHHQESPWADLVIAVLSVNNYPMTKVLNIFESLNANGLFDPCNFARWDRKKIARTLGSAGYDRGQVMTEIFTERLSSLGGLADELAVNERILREGTRAEVAELLKRVKGVGPKVLNNFFLLRG